MLHGPLAHAIEAFSIGGTGAQVGEALPKDVTEPNPVGPPPEIDPRRDARDT
jgi:hypothetical protein